jgi:hypothetical protein
MTDTGMLLITPRQGRRVSAKPANRGMLAGQKGRIAHQARLEEEALSRQTKQSTSHTSTPTTPKSLLSKLTTVILPLLITTLLLSNFLTSTWTFNLYTALQPRVSRHLREDAWSPWKIEMREFTPEQLSLYDGRAENPVYLALDGDVYDVTANRRIYGKGGSYNMM